MNFPMNSLMIYTDHCVIVVDVKRVISDDEISRYLI